MDLVYLQNRVRRLQRFLRTARKLMKKGPSFCGGASRSPAGLYIFEKKEQAGRWVLTAGQTIYCFFQRIKNLQLVLRAPVFSCLPLWGLEKQSSGNSGGAPNRKCPFCRGCGPLGEISGFVPRRSRLCQIAFSAALGRLNPRRTKLIFTFSTSSRLLRFSYVSIFTKLHFSFLLHLFLRDLSGRKVDGRISRLGLFRLHSGLLAAEEWLPRSLFAPCTTT